MWIDEYIYHKGWTKKAFAEMLGMNPVHFREIAKGKKSISKKNAKKIEELTEGQVTAQEMLLGDVSQMQLPPEKRIKK